MQKTASELLVELVRNDDYMPVHIVGSHLLEFRSIFTGEPYPVRFKVTGEIRNSRWTEVSLMPDGGVGTWLVSPTKPMTSSCALSHF